MVIALFLLSPFLALGLVTYLEARKRPSLYDLVSKNFEATVRNKIFSQEILVTLPRSRVQARIFIDNSEDTAPRKLCLETKVSPSPRHFSFLLKKKYFMMDIQPWGIKDVSDYPYFPHDVSWAGWVLKIDDNRSLLEIFDATLLKRLNAFDNLTPQLTFDGRTLTYRSEALLAPPFPPERFKRFFGPSLKPKWDEEKMEFEEFPNQLVSLIELFDDFVLRYR